MQLIPVTYLRAFVEALDLTPSRLAAMLVAAGIRPDTLDAPGAALPLKRVQAALGWLDSQLSPGWHIAPSLSLGVAHHGPLGMAVVTAPTVSRALEVLARHERLRAPWAMVRLERHDQAWRLHLVAVVDLPQPRDVLMEISLLAMAGLVEKLLGRDRDRLGVEFPRRYRAHELALRRCLAGSVDVSAPGYGLVIPGMMLDRASPMADQATHRLALAGCRSSPGQRQPAPELVETVRRRLADQGGQASAAEIAAELGMSVRTLNRQLAAAGTGLRELAGEVRRSLACDYLLHSELSVAEIAMALGYGDPANFGRAFRRWSGMSPGRFRQTGGQIKQSA